MESDIKIIPYKDNLCSKYATKMLSIKLNNSCNCHCQFCVDRGGFAPNTIDVLKIAQEAINLSEYKTIIITGGEPFLNFNEVISLATLLRPYKTRIVLNTNGTLLTSEKVKMLNTIIDELQVSIHHYSEQVNAKVFNKYIVFNDIREALINKQFVLSINSTFNNSYLPEEMPYAVDKMIELCKWLNADKLRLTELKKVDDRMFIPASSFFGSDNPVLTYNSKDLIQKGCTYYYTKNGIKVSVKRLCEYAKGKDAPAFSCCFINTEGQKKINVDTKNTFKVIYSDGTITDDWIFNTK